MKSHHKDANMGRSCRTDNSPEAWRVSFYFSSFTCVCDNWKLECDNFKAHTGSLFAVCENVIFKSAIRLSFYRCDESKWRFSRLLSDNCTHFFISEYIYKNFVCGDLIIFLNKIGKKLNFSFIEFIRNVMFFFFVSIGFFKFQIKCLIECLFKHFKFSIYTKSIVFYGKS